MKDRVTIKIPRELYDNLQSIVEGTGFSSVSELIVFTMRTLASAGRIDRDAGLTGEEIRAVKERLKKLGYL